MILVTGATGFIGRAIVEGFFSSNLPVVASSRNLLNSSDKFLYLMKDSELLQWQAVGEINDRTNWLQVVQPIKTVVHCAAYVHGAPGNSVGTLAANREVNVAGTLRLAHHAVSIGVQRFVFMSTIKVNGEFTAKGQSFSESALPAPADAYGQSKLEAETALLMLGAQTGMEVVIIRPPLVYGIGVKGNFAGMAKAVQRGLPLPLGAVHNQRSLVALDNLVSLVLLCADRERSPQAANQVFVVADGEDVSTSTLLRKVARAAGRPSRLLPVPASWLRAGAGLLGKRTVADRLLGNLQVDATKARTLLGWQPVVTMDEQLAKMF